MPYEKPPAELGFQTAESKVFTITGQVTNSSLYLFLIIPLAQSSESLDKDLSDEEEFYV